MVRTAFEFVPKVMEHRLDRNHSECERIIAVEAVICRRLCLITIRIYYLFEIE